MKILAQFQHFSRFVVLLFPRAFPTQFLLQHLHPFVPVGNIECGNYGVEQHTEADEIEEMRIALTTPKKRKAYAIGDSAPFHRMVAEDEAPYGE